MIEIVAPADPPVGSFSVFLSRDATEGEEALSGDHAAAVQRAAGAVGGAGAGGQTTAVLQQRPLSSLTRKGGCDGGRRRADRALLERYLEQRDPVDDDMLVERFLPLARQLARRYQRPEEPFDDLFQEACLGLVKAIDRFDLSRDVAFSTYAVPTMLGEIKRYFRDRTWSVRVPRELQERALRVDQKVAELFRRKPTNPVSVEVSPAHQDLRGPTHYLPRRRTCRSSG